MKPKFLKHKLKEWSKKVIADLRTKNKLLSELADIHLAQDSKLFIEGSADVVGIQYW